ncbi:serine hydrolase domain-containing protein [Lusitaniella coriacea]|uniref:serine hydrolase domain-containing protein n=1 Tax=Lusitaniella coriacea TaxID=1983105 RepID=UPI003CF52176
MQHQNTSTNMNTVYRTTALLSAAIALGINIPGTAYAATLTADINASPSTLIAERPTPPPLPPKLVQKLQKTLDSTLSDSGSVGAVVGIATPVGSWFGASGQSNLNPKTEVSPRDRFPIGSITKTFVATTILQLVEEEVLSLDDTLNQWLPPDITQHVEYSDKITLRNLLNHTSGIYSYTEKLQTEGEKNPSLFIRDWTPKELVAYSGEPNIFAPGEKWSYSNTNYILLGMIVEAASGSSLESEIRARILDPLGLENTFFGGEEEIPGGYASGYLDLNEDGDFEDIVDGIPEDVTPFNLTQAWAAGAMVSNTQDLTRFIQALFAGELLAPDTFAQMRTVTDTGMEGFSYGLGIFSRDIPGIGKVWGHNGGVAAFSSNLLYAPDLGITYVDLQNSQPASNLAPTLTDVLLTSVPSESVPESTSLVGFLFVGIGLLAQRTRQR